MERAAEAVAAFNQTEVFSLKNSDHHVCPSDGVIQNTF
jgi:hypothetical protein